MQDAAGLWRDYAEHRSSETKEKLILLYAGLVRQIVGRMPQSALQGVDYDDLLGYGVIGLLDAIEKYDVNRGVKFETYATTRIRGSIIDQLRSMDWVPRSVRQRAREVERAYASCEARTGRPATDDELAAQLSIAPSTLHSWIADISKAAMMSLDEIITIDEDSGLATVSDFVKDNTSPDPEIEYEATELREVLAESIDTLPEREKLVITLYYYDELTIREIAEVMGVSESRVSQLHTKAMMRLRSKLKSLRDAMAV